MESIILAIMLCVTSAITVNFFQLLFTKDDLVNIKSNHIDKRTAISYTSTSIGVIDKGLVPENDKDLLLIKAAMTLILEHYTDPYFNTEKLARMLTTSPRSLQRKFKLFRQSSPSKEIKKHRLERSVTGLNASHKIKRVVFDSGFSSPSYFCKCFKEHYGCTPSEYLFKNG